MTIDGASISKAQVVLITASEFLREEEKDEKQDSKKKTQQMATSRRTYSLRMKPNQQELGL